ncbi:hypothetical protein TSAR_015885 [Trichomalopsis sarcophagae]|uniref:Uncharacterized protein n=1 Tax=Trichomalopsis sarcophagae TaxID=543379 RepID=A0A232FHY1_9HYME|nr:hypothetical protein TSAR_015885 [Trichomalopsis sarcophagae]
MLELYGVVPGDGGGPPVGYGMQQTPHPHRHHNHHHHHHNHVHHHHHQQPPPPPRRIVSTLQAEQLAALESGKILATREMCKFESSNFSRAQPSMYFTFPF